MAGDIDALAVAVAASPLVFPAVASAERVVGDGDSADEEAKAATMGEERGFDATASRCLLSLLSVSRTADVTLGSAAAAGGVERYD